MSEIFDMEIVCFWAFIVLFTSSMFRIALWLICRSETKEELIRKILPFVKYHRKDLERMTLKELIEMRKRVSDK
jgi:hypothetical protein